MHYHIHDPSGLRGGPLVSPELAEEVIRLTEAAMRGVGRPVAPSTILPCDDIICQSVAVVVEREHELDMAAMRGLSDAEAEAYLLGRARALFMQEGER